METVAVFIFWGSKITAHGDCSHKIRRCLFLGRKAMTNLDSVLKSRDIPLLTKSIQSRLWSLQWSHMVVRAGLKRTRRAEKLMLSNCEKTPETPESPLDSKEIEAVNLKGNQP